MIYIEPDFGIEVLCAATTADIGAYEMMNYDSFYDNAVKSANRLNKCLTNFQKIEDELVKTLPRRRFNVVDIFSTFLRQGHTRKNALLLTKMTILGEISPYVSSFLPSYELTLSRLAKEFENQKLFLKKESKNVPHYRDIEFKHKRKRL